MMVYVTRKTHFNAAHKMWNPAWTAERNKEVFGLCSNENWHGHNYELEVTVAGTPDPETGYVMDVRELHRIIEEVILNKVDHKNLNLDVDFMQGKMASSEIFAVEIWNQLAPRLNTKNRKLHIVRLQETPRIFVEYRGEE